MEHKSYTCDRCGHKFEKEPEPIFKEHVNGRPKWEVVAVNRYFDTESMPMQWRNADFCPGCIIAIIVSDVEGYMSCAEPDDDVHRMSRDPKYRC